MKNLSYIFGLLLLLLYAVSSQATIIVTSIEARATPAGRTYGCEQGATQCKKEYKVTWKKVPGPRDNEVVPPGVTLYGAMEEHNHISFWCNMAGSGLFGGVMGTVCVSVPRGATWGMVEDLWIRTYGPTGPGIVEHQGDADSRECVMFAGMTTQGSAIGTQVNNGPLVCVGAPPTPDPQCVIEGNPVFNFDISLGQDTSGMQRATTINLRCNLAANVTLMDTTGNNGRVELGWGYADVKVNGQILPLNLRPNPSLPLQITATLHGIATQAGVAEGSVVIVVGYQ